MRIWKVSACLKSRSVPDFLLRWGLILNDGNPDTLRDFDVAIQDGDVVVLHTNSRRVWGVGRVVGDSGSRDDLRDVYGINARHYRRVQWLWRAEIDDPKLFPYGMLEPKEGITGLQDCSLRTWAEEIVESAESRPPRPLVELPPGGGIEDLSLETLATSLAEAGLSSDLADRLPAEIRALTPIMQRYEHYLDPGSDLDRLAFLVVPLLRALGWSAAHTSISDFLPPALVKLFDGGYGPKNTRPQALLTVRWLYPAERSGASELLRFARRLGRESFRCAILTDGIRYGVYEHQGDGVFPARPTAWLNLLRMRARYPLMECEGAVRAMELMSEGWRDG